MYSTTSMPRGVNLGRRGGFRSRRGLGSEGTKPKRSPVAEGETGLLGTQYSFGIGAGGGIRGCSSPMPRGFNLEAVRMVPG